MKANEVEDFDDSVADLVERMTMLMDEARGVGLAAPQLGVLRRVLVYRTADDEPVTALVNPRIVSSQDESDVVDEGCLWLGAATVVVGVERPVAVTLEAQTPRASLFRSRPKGCRRGLSSTRSTTSTAC